MVTFELYVSVSAVVTFELYVWVTQYVLLQRWVRCPTTTDLSFMGSGVLVMKAPSSNIFFNFLFTCFAVCLHYHEEVRARFAERSPCDVLGLSLSMLLTFPDKYSALI